MKYFNQLYNRNKTLYLDQRRSGRITKWHIKFIIKRVTTLISTPRKHIKHPSIHSINNGLDKSVISTLSFLPHSLVSLVKQLG